MTSVCTRDPFFVAVEASGFERDHIAGLAAGRYAAIQVADFLPAQICSDVLTALARVPFDAYDTKRVDPPVFRFGIGVSDHRVDGVLAETYWTALDSSRQAWSALPLDYDPFDLCRAGLGRDWPGAVRIARSGGRELGPGVAREPNQGFQVHFDDSIREFPGRLVDVNLVAQFAFNLYLSVPEDGGQTIVWRHRWGPGDESFRLPDSYGYRSAVVGESESFTLSPAVGQALLFDPRNYHAVLPSRGGRRIGLGFAVGLTDSGELHMWG
ncbi:proline hydroxylase [Nocardia jejuensis]|uniref:proline hydroxylase n=1 Tax=Nocardia jejuensis TaxID=328049 RepID=UPI00082F0FBB|nr:proline hydroxylase [Nocardia jejuensis]